MKRKVKVGDGNRNNKVTKVFAFMKCSVCLLELRMAAMVVRVRGTRKRRKEEMTLVVVCKASFVVSV